MLKVDNFQSPAFRGVWGDVQYKNEKPVVHYYPFIDETADEIKREVSSKINNPENFHTQTPGWSVKMQKLTAIVTEPLNFTKAEFEKFNRGFMSDTLARMLLKK